MNGILQWHRKRTNILWLVSEDNSPMIGAYDDKLAHTPVIDRLASRGILYRRAYATAPVCAVSRFAILTGAFAQSCGPAHHMRAVAAHPTELPGYPEYLRKAGYYCTNHNKNDYNTDIDPHKIWNQCGTKAHWRNRPVDTPFMSVFNYMSTHESTLNRPTEGRVKPDDVTVPPYLPDTAAIRSEIPSYYNRIEIMDGEIGARLEELERDGLVDDTIVFYYSGHGGALPRSKHFCYEEGARACMIVAYSPRCAHLAPVPMGSAIETLVSFADLAPNRTRRVCPRPYLRESRRRKSAGLLTKGERRTYGSRDIAH